MKRIACIFVLISTLVLLISSCKKEGEGVDPVEIDMNAFNNAKTNWEQLNIKNYTFDCTFEVRVDPYTVVVRNGVVHEITPEPGDFEFEYLRHFTGTNMTIDNLFREIERISNDPYVKVSGVDWCCYDAVINYDATYYYPKTVQLSFGFSEIDKDDEYFIAAPDVIIKITRFEAEFSAL